MTGQPQWEKRYRRFLLELDAAIDQAIDLVPVAHAELAAVGDANAALVRLADQDFALVRQSESTRGRELLNGDEYRRKMR